MKLILSLSLLALVFATTGCKKKVAPEAVAKVHAATDSMCACLKLPMEAKPLEACQKTASAQFQAASKEAGANPFGALNDHDYDAESVETMAKEAAAYRTCMSQTLEATMKARGAK